MGVSVGPTTGSWATSQWPHSKKMTLHSGAAINCQWLLSQWWDPGALLIYAEMLAGLSSYQQPQLCVLKAASHSTGQLAASHSTGPHPPCSLSAPSPLFLNPGGMVMRLTEGCTLTIMVSARLMVLPQLWPIVK